MPSFFLNLPLGNVIIIQYIIIKTVVDGHHLRRPNERLKIHTYTGIHIRTTKESILDLAYKHGN